MKRGFSIRLMMLIVLALALDFSILRGWLSTYFDPGIVYVTLPMANVLILVAPRAWSGGPGKSFWIGFEAVGWLMAGLFGYLAWAHGATFFEPANSVYPWNTITDRYYQTAYLFTIDLICYTPPEILAAWAGGRLATRLGRAIARRRAGTPRSEASTAPGVEC